MTDSTQQIHNILF